MWLYNKELDILLMKTHNLFQIINTLSMKYFKFRNTSFQQTLLIIDSRCITKEEEKKTR